MKKFLLIFLALICIISISYNLYAASGRQYGWQVITTTGTTAITPTFNTTEIYVVALSTPPGYINWTSTTVTTSDFPIGQHDQTDVIEHTEEVTSYRFGVRYDTGPVNVLMQWKGW